MFFLCFHIRHLNPLETHLERITNLERQMVNGLVMVLIMMVLDFLSLKRITARLKQKIAFSLIYLVVKMVCYSCFR